MPSTPVTPRAISMLWVILNGTFSGTRRLLPATQENEQVTHYMENRYCYTPAAKNNPSAGFPPTSQCVIKSFESYYGDCGGKELHYICTEQADEHR